LIIENRKGVSVSKYDIFSKINGKRFKIKTFEKHRHAKKFIKKIAGVESGINGFLMNKFGIKPSFKMTIYIEIAKLRHRSQNKTK